MSRRSRELAINREIKAKVFERDGGRCVICGRPGNPEAHFISRAQGGLGVEQNIVTLCRECHRRFDQTSDRTAFRGVLRAYLMSKYPHWNEEKIIYRRK